MSGRLPPGIREGNQNAKRQSDATANAKKMQPATAGMQHRKPGTTQTKNKQNAKKTQRKAKKKTKKKTPKTQGVLHFRPLRSHPDLPSRGFLIEGGVYKIEVDVIDGIDVESFGLLALGFAFPDS